ADPGRLSVRIQGKRYAWKGANFPSTYRLIPAPVAPNDPHAAGSADDLAVILLKAPVQGVATLPIADPPPAVGQASLTVGHGQTGEGLAPSFNQGGLGASQTVVDACPDAYGPKLFKPALHLCTQDTTATKSQACAGDSG